MPISTAQGAGGISIQKDYRVDRTVLTVPEMQAILTGLGSLDSVSGTRRYTRLMEKLSAGTGGLAPGGAHVLIDLSIQFTYFSPKEESVRNIEPYTWYSTGPTGMCGAGAKYERISVSLS